MTTLMTESEEAPGPPAADLPTGQFRLAAQAYLESLLPRRSATTAVSVLGAGTDERSLARQVLARLGGDGWSVPEWPVGLGGVGLSPEAASIWREELLAFDLPDLYAFRIGLNMVGPTLLEHGSEQQQQRWLPRIATGEEIWCQLFSEPGAGSDLAGLATAARRTGDSWEVTGQKVWSSRAQYADWGLLLARCDPSAAKHQGIVCLAMPMHADGVEVRPLRQINGDSHFNEVFLDRVAVDDALRIGPAGAGWTVARTTLAHERVAVGNVAPLTADQLIQLARDRALTDHPVMRDRLMATIVQLEVARLSAQRARATGASAGPMGSAAKLRTVRTLQAAAALVADLIGLEITVEPSVWQTLLLTAPSMSIRGGTDEILRDVLGERVLGLPKEPDMYRGRPWSEIPRS